MKLKKCKLAMAIIPWDKHRKENGARFQEPRSGLNLSGVSL